MDRGGPLGDQETDREKAGEPPRRRRGPSDRVFKWTAAVAGAVLIGFVAYVVAQGPSPKHGPSSAALAAQPPATLGAGTVAPAFTLPSLGTGAPVSLASFRGTPVIVNFFASWCPDCRGELAAVASVARSSAGRVDVVGVDSNESSVATSSRLLAAAHASYPVGLDSSAKVATEYEIQALPVSYFLDARGRVVGTALGPQTVRSLQAWVVRLERGT